MGRLGFSLNSDLNDNTVETSNLTGNMTDSVVKASAPKTTNADIYVRQTFYLTYEEIAAIDKISYEEDIQKSELIRELIDEALDKRIPGILKSKEVLAKAQRTKEKKSK